MITQTSDVSDVRRSVVTIVIINDVDTEHLTIYDNM